MKNTYVVIAYLLVHDYNYLPIYLFDIPINTSLGIYKKTLMI